MEALLNYFQLSGFGNVALGNLIMIVVGCIFIYLAIVFHYEPLLLIPIGFGVLLGNVPIPLPGPDGTGGLRIGVYEPGSVMNWLYWGVTSGVYPPLIFLGIGAMTDFSSMLARPKLILLGAAAQIGVFLTLLGAILLDWVFPIVGLSSDPLGVLDPQTRLLQAAASIGIIGGADGPTAIFLSSQLAPDLLGAIAISAYSYMALVPVLQPPVMKLLTSKEERLIRMGPPQLASKAQKVFFPIVGLIVTLFIVPGALPLLGMLFFGNLLKESGVTERLASTARNAFIDIVTILLGVTVGMSTQANTFLTVTSVAIFALGAVSFMVATAGGVLFAKLMNVVSKEKINPLIGAAGVSAVPDSARVVQHVGQQEDPQNFLLMHAMAPNVAGVIGSAVAAGVLLAVLR